MADDTDDAEKTEEPTQYRIDEFRKRGQVASSKELTSVLVLLASLMTLSLSVVYVYETMGNFIEWLYTQDLTTLYSEEKFKKVVETTAVLSLKLVGPLFIVVFIIGFFANVMQVGWLFSPEVMNLKFERINPLEGFKRIFSMRSIVTAIKGVFKFAIILSITYVVVKDQMPTYAGFLHTDVLTTFLQAKWYLIQVGFSIVLGLIVVAIGDFAWEKYSYRKKLMMTKQEAKREHKEHEGNPEIKQKIKLIQREMSQKRMMNRIPQADVVITNPTHISIVVKYDSETMVSPQVIGKGADHLALKIREIAKKHNIPIVENVVLARTLYKTVKTGASIPRNLYKAVAEVLAFVYKLRKKQRAIETGVSR